MAGQVSLGRLAEALKGEGGRAVGDASVVVSDVREDSRRVEPGDLFAARVGGSRDGTRFVADAVARGAVAVLVARGTSLGAPGVPILEVDDVRRALGMAAEIVHGRPSRALDVVGVTGTNGKTTVSWLAQSAISSAGGRAARLGTLGYALGEDRVDSPLTTPAADEVSRYLARARDAGGSHVVMEVSSHALVQARVDALSFRAAAFTNLTQDHLDFHATMDEYAGAKARLFVDLSPGVSVINVDDDFGRELATRVRGDLITVSRRGDADVYPESISHGTEGLSGNLRVASKGVDVSTRLVGDHNLENVLVTLGIVAALGLDVQRAADGLGGATAVPGRLERCDAPGDDILVLVDYAHTPDALRRALGTCRRLTDGRLICVFGCGGDRDAGKRSQMGRAVADEADWAIVTNDNPRSEDPEVIAGAIEGGMAGARYEVILDRSRAIERAVVEAEPGDVVLIAGKGHEPHQLVGNRVLDFDDRREARRGLAVRRKRTGPGVDADP